MLLRALYIGVVNIKKNWTFCHIGTVTIKLLVHNITKNLCRCFVMKAGASFKDCRFDRIEETVWVINQTFTQIYNWYSIVSNLASVLVLMETMKIGGEQNLWIANQTLILLVCELFEFFQKSDLYIIQYTKKSHPYNAKSSIVLYLYSFRA